MDSSDQRPASSSTSVDAGHASRQGEARGRFGQLVARPAVVILLVAPFFGEGLSGATPPLDLVLPWTLALMVALYGCGALIIREVVRRYRLGLPGLCLLGAAFGVYEEALVDRYWFYPQFWDDAGVGSYSQVWHTNLLLAVHLTAFHTAVSICASILILERLFPAYRERPWAGRAGLVVAAVALGLVPLVYGEFSRRPPALVLIAAGALCLILVGCAFCLPPPSRRLVTPPRSPRRGLGIVAFTCTLAHFVAVYSLPSTGIPWPLGLLIALVPIAAGVAVIPRMATTGPYGHDGLRTVAGILTFFVLLDVVVGLAGRYDLIVSGIATAFALRRLYLRDRPRPA